jgi:hypothetical protein
MSNNRASLIGIILIFFVLMFVYGNKTILLIFITTILIFWTSLMELNLSKKIKVIDIIQLYTSNSRIETANTRINTLLSFPKILAFYPYVLFVGIGFNQWQFVIFNLTKMSSAHNQLFNIIVEFGIFSFIFFYFFVYLFKNISTRFKILLIILTIISFTAEYLLPRPAFEGLSYLILITILINDEIQKKADRGTLTAEGRGNIERNVAHLEIVMGDPQIVELGGDLSDLTAAITNGKAALE